jgi:hypothetical protein
MSDLWTLEDVDRDGAIRETAEKVDPFTRASLLKKAGLGVDFKGTTSDQTTFEETASVLEDTGVQASLGSRRRSDGASLQGRQPSGEVESRDASALLSASRELTSSFR